MSTRSTRVRCAQGVSETNSNSCYLPAFLPTHAEQKRLNAIVRNTNGLHLGLTFRLVRLTFRPDSTCFLRPHIFLPLHLQSDVDRPECSTRTGSESRCCAFHHRLDTSTRLPVLTFMPNIVTPLRQAVLLRSQPSLFAFSTARSTTCIYRRSYQAVTITRAVDEKASAAAEDSTGSSSSR